MANRILTKIALEGGSKLLDSAARKLTPPAPPANAKKPSLIGKIAGAALIRVATRSVPGAIVVGGGLLAKTLYDRRKARRADKTKP